MQHWKPDPWLSQMLERPCFLGRWSAQLRHDEWPFEAGSFAHIKIPAKELKTCQQLIRRGFELIDTHLSFDYKQQASAFDAALLRQARAEDRDAVVAIASESFRFSRFHLDERIPNTLAHRLKGEWTANFFRQQRGDRCLVFEREGRPVGFILLLCDAQKWVIDLIALSPAFQAQGLGLKMLQGLSAYAAQAAPSLQGLQVGTQIQNIPSIRLYEKFGFQLKRAEYVLHYHGDF